MILNWWALLWSRRRGLEVLMVGLGVVLVGLAVEETGRLDL